MNFDIEELLSNPNDLQRRTALVVLFPILFVFVTVHSLVEMVAEMVPEVVEEFGQIWKAPLR